MEFIRDHSQRSDYSDGLDFGLMESLEKKIGSPENGSIAQLLKRKSLEI